MKKKIAIIAGIVFVVLLVLAMLAVLGFKLYDHIKYNDFYDVAEREYYIPGLMEGYVPQGFDYMEEEKVFLSCGYMSNDKASRVYVISEDGDEFYYTELMAKNGREYTGHTGGVAYYGEYLYITGSDGVDVFYLSDILDKSIPKAAHIGTILTCDVECEDCDAGNCDEHVGFGKGIGINPAYCFIYDGELFVGSFHKDGDYNTPEKHHITTGAGDENKAMMVSFALGTGKFSKYGIYGEFSDKTVDILPTPVAAYSMPSFVQGVCVASYETLVENKMTTAQRMVLSTSWGLTTSRLSFYDLKKVRGTTSDYISKEYGMDVPLYYVDSASLVESDTVEAPPMSEEIVYLDGKIWIMNESACNKYIFGKLTTGNYLYSVEYPKKAK